MVTNVPEGYKQTEAGLIPEDWDIASYGDNLSIISGLGFKKAEYKNNGVKLLRIDNVSYGNIMWESIAYLPQDYIEKYKGLIIEENDILLALNRPITNGKLKIAIASNKDVPAILYQRVGKIIFINEAYDKKYAFHLLTKFIKKFVEQSAVGTDQPFISTTNLKQYKIPLPPQIEEQKAIAQALSDVDAAIAELDRLITKKRNIKRIAMQQLLTGKKRLPGFSDEWKPMPVGLLSAFITKGATPTTYGFSWKTHGILFLRSECVTENRLDLTQSMFISPQAHSVLKRSEIQGSDILITITGNVGRIVYLKKDFGIANINQHIARIRIIDNNVLAAYVFYFLSQPSVRNYYNSITTGQAYPQISLRQVRETAIFLPSFSEQKAIAQVLTDMDTEIKALEQKRDKYKAIKQGMMQELLTGRTRLV